MRAALSKLCLVLSSLVVMNLVVFVVFRPKGWKSRRFQIISSGINLTMVQNVTIVSYRKVVVSNAANEDCVSATGLAGGKIVVNMTSAESYFWSESNAEVEDVVKNDSSRFLGLQTSLNGSSMGGIAMFEPTNCKHFYSVAIIVPFRDRETHLRILLGHLVPILRKQLLRYSIFVMEQNGGGTFNKGRLMNTGFEVAYTAGSRAEMPYDCFIFQDVDLLVEHDSLLHRCAKGNSVRHLSTAINKFDYKPLCCGMTVGGVLAVKEQQFRKVNGFPNSYWGWGGEDDDINKRFRFNKIKIFRPKAPLGRYTMIKHAPDKGNPYNENVHRNVQLALRRMREDGLSNLDTKILSVTNYPLFTKVLVDVGKAE